MMPNSKNDFFKFGHYIYQFRKAIVVFWVLLFITCLPLLSTIIAPFQDTGFVADGSVSDKTEQFLSKKLGFGHNQFIVLYHSKHLIATDPEYLSQIKHSLSGLKDLDIKSDIIYPQEQQISADKHTAYAVIYLKTSDTLSTETLHRFVASIKQPKSLTMHLGGDAIFVEKINQQTPEDLYRGDLFAIPVSIITLLFIFGSVSATLVPMGIGACCALFMLTILFVIGYLTPLSIFTLNIASLLTLCLSLDYALFVINRFRDELNAKKDIEACIQSTLSTAGKAVFYSGLAVFTSLSALLFFPINILSSIGIGGLVAVFVAVSASLTLLPAILAILEHRINAFPVRKITVQRFSARNKKGIWYRIAHTVVNNSLKYFSYTLLFLLCLASTVFKIQVGVSNLHILPAQSESQRFFSTYEKNFNQQELNPILLVVSANSGNILDPKYISDLYDLVAKIKNDPRVSEVNSIVSINPSLTKKQYKALYQTQQRPPDLEQFLEHSTRRQFTAITIISRYSADSPKTKALIKTLRELKPGKGLVSRLTGTPVINAEVLSVVAKIMPYALLWVLIMTYLILLFLLRSIVLPLKAIIMNILSLCTSYGVLIYIFQEGHFHTLLGFNPQGILDINLIIILFCALFGFSMDYEVFLLTRIHEAYIEHQDNKKSIIFGIVKSSRIITSAALIVIVLCGSYMVADVLIVKEFGLGIAIAIFVDAFLIRTLLVPATMAILNTWNWYLPKWLVKCLPKDV